MTGSNLTNEEVTETVIFLFFFGRSDQILNNETLAPECQALAMR